MAVKRRYQDRREYMIRAVQKRRKLIKEQAIDHKGGKCEVCGYSRCRDALEFHHLDDNNKSFGISEKGYTRSWEKSKPRSGNVYYCAPIVTVNYTAES